MCFAFSCDVRYRVSSEFPKLLVVSGVWQLDEGWLHSAKNWNNYKFKSGKGTFFKTLPFFIKWYLLCSFVIFLEFLGFVEFASFLVWFLYWGEIRNCKLGPTWLELQNNVSCFTSNDECTTRLLLAYRMLNFYLPLLCLLEFDLDFRWKRVLGGTFIWNHCFTLL